MQLLFKRACIFTLLDMLRSYLCDLLVNLLLNLLELDFPKLHTQFLVLLLIEPE
jgi:hypothetical protein